MQRHVDLIAGFYGAFQRRDAAAMAACYGPDARFSDPVFPALSGPAVGAMWRMLCARGADLRVEARNITADATGGSAHWEAWYTFAATGRPVHNIIEASFRFADGRIQVHVDRFSFHRWARQALGPKGALLGWLPPVQRAVQAQAARALASYRRQDATG
ncbi:MAG TPA: nuclear transport factor 2 family protein [Gemmatimonadales bacterium]|nr:nuclear transport factor 2 family protein [Gemmatimonadales bacterium]